MPFTKTLKTFGVFTILLAFTVLTSESAYAFYTVQDTGDLLKEDEIQYAAELQFVTSGDDGINIIGRLDKGFDSDSNLRFMVGTGTTDFEVGAFYKWVPFPDFESQPAVGFTFGAHLAHYESENELAARFIPFTSKLFETDVGTLTPYLALPISFQNYNEDSEMPIQLVIGTRYKHPEYDQADYTVELGFDVKDAVTYISLGAIF